MNLCNRITVTIVGAEYPVNVGHTARLLKNFGVKQLVLVDPKFDFRVAEVYASHGADLLEQAKISTLQQVREENDLLIATTAIRATRSANISRSAITPEEAMEHIGVARSAALILGRDTTGLRNEEIAICDFVTTIETRTSYRTLNLSHSVAILLYLASNVHTRPAGRQKNAFGETREVFFRYVAELAAASGLPNNRIRGLHQVMRRVAIKSNLNKSEIGLLITLMRKATITIERERRNIGPLQGRSST